MRRPSRRPARWFLCAVTAWGAAGLFVAAGVQAAVPDGATGHYADATVGGASGGWTGAVGIDAAGFPAATLTSTSSSLSRAGGTSAYLGPATPFGERFGTSARQPYLTADSATGRTPSVTTLRFAGPTPASGWGFALGDVDADRVTVAATDADGAALTGAALAAALGWQSSFNYCAATPKPPSCTGAGPFTDLPTWDPATATLSGSGTNTFGAAGWFTPTVELGSLTFTFSVQTGSPNYQIWLAALSVPVTGVVEGASAATPGATISLLDADGDPVASPDGDPVRADVARDGSFRFPAVTDGDYLLRIDPGDDARVTADRDPVPVRVDTDNGAITVPAGTFAIAALAPSTTPSPTTTAPAPSTTPTGQSPGAASPGSRAAIANTGYDPALPLVVGIALVVAGTALSYRFRRNPARRR